MIDGLVRTPMGNYVLRDDTCLSRWVEHGLRLDTDANIIEIASFAARIPEGGVVIDAGACIGDHTVTYSQIVGTRGIVYAFEPHAVSYEALRMNVERLNNVRTLQIGLSDHVGHESFVRDPNIGASFMSDNVTDEQVKVTTLDSYLLPHLSRCDFIHLDTEGREPRVLNGAKELLAAFHPVMVLEVCDKHLRRGGSSEPELMALLAALGYQVLPIQSHTEPELRDILAVWG